MRVREVVREAIAQRGQAHVALSGGSTPRAMHARLARLEGIEWPRVHVWWGDERFVPPEHSDSNQRMARETLLSLVAIPESNIHPVESTPDAATAARSYEAALRRMVTAVDAEGTPRLDLVLLGIGSDGHTLSLFPGAAEPDPKLLVISAVAPPTSPVKDRVTLTKRTARAARTRVFLAVGADKRALIDSCVHRGGINGGAVHPAATVGDAEWYVDPAAGPAGR